MCGASNSRAGSRAVLTAPSRSFAEGTERVNPAIDGIYFASVTFTTVGYGDITPSSFGMKIFVMLYIFVGIGFVGYCLGEAADYLLQIQTDTMARGAQSEDKAGGGSQDATAGWCCTPGKSSSNSPDFAALIHAVPPGTS